tara:strand:+ start:60419 stop:61540 length:1122 start_codon:yes stop_codon:yes gene_type:complete
MSSQAIDKAKIGKIAFEKGNTTSKAEVFFKGDLSGTPILTVRKNIIQVSVPGSYVWPKVEKSISLNDQFDSSLQAYQFTKDKVRFRVVLPYDIESKKNNVSVTLRDNSFAVSFPRLKSVNKVANSRKPAIKNPEKAVTSYDESYLDRLMKDQESVPEVKIDNKQNVANTKTKAAADEVKVTQAANDSSAKKTDFLANNTKKENKSSFSLTGYIGKFVAFLGLILVFFWGAVQLMKKGAFKKSKLSFLNSTKVVEVINNTYIGPKKSLVLVRAHNQVFLVGSSETGLQLISEVNDVSGLMKDGEKQIAGDNFDTNLGSANSNNKEFKLKDVISENKTASQSEGLDKLLADTATEDKVKLSDQIKDKVKNLKSLQ